MQLYRMKCLKFLVGRKYSLVQKYEWNVPVSWWLFAAVAYYFNCFVRVVFALPFWALAILIRLLLYTNKNWWLDIFFTPSVPRVNSGGVTVTLFCCICVLYSSTPKWNLLFFSSKFPFLRDLSQLPCFSSNLYTCLSIHRSVHCNSFNSTKYYHIRCLIIWWDFSCVETYYYYHQAVGLSQMIGFTVILASCHMNLFFMICDLSGLYLCSLGKSVTLTFWMQVQRLFVWTQMLCSVKSSQADSLDRVQKCSSISEIDSVPIFTVITVPGCLGKKKCRWLT